VEKPFDQLNGEDRASTSSMSRDVQVLLPGNAA
jgi:hypothetical protein